MSSNFYVQSQIKDTAYVVDIVKPNVEENIGKVFYSVGNVCF